MFKQITRKLRKSRGYVMILVAVALPVLFLGMQYLLKSGDVSHNEAQQTNAAAAVGMAVLNAYNPGITWSKQSKLVYSAGAQALNDKTYSIFKKMLIEPANNSISETPSSISAGNLAYVYATMYHKSNLYNKRSMHSISDYPIADVNYSSESNTASYNQYGGDSGPIFRLNYSESSNLSVALDQEHEAIVCDCPCINRRATAYPAECDVDIILTIPTNNTACTASTPQIETIAKAYENVLHHHFMHTKGVAVGLIPYSGKISIPPSRENWTISIPQYNYGNGNYGNANSEPRLTQVYVYSSDGQVGGSITNDIYNWGNYTNDANQTCSNYSIMSRCGSLGTGSNNILSQNQPDPYIDGFFEILVYVNDNPDGTRFIAPPFANSLSYLSYRTRDKFRRMNLNPCYLGYCNLLGDACEKTCPTYQPNPFFIQELTDDVFGVAYDLSLFQAIKDDYNKSNFLFLPVHWACNLLSDWTDHPGRNAATNEQLSHPDRSGKKKAIILVVNAPNNFEPKELTYLGFNNDAAELPMSESDVIDFSKNMRSGTKGIITYSGNGSIDPETKEFVCDGTGYLKFPRKGLVKLVVEKATFAFDGENSGRHNISGSQTFIFSGPTLPKDGTAGIGNKYNSTQGINFGGNLSGKKVKYKLENARITACDLYGQVLRDYAGQYGRGLSRVRPLILNDGTPAKRSGTNPYTVYETFGITRSGNLNSVSGLRDRVQKFMDPCMRIANNPYYSNAKERGEYQEQTLQYVVNGLAETRYYMYFYCAILTNNLNITHYLYDSLFGNLYENYFTSDSVYNDWRWRELKSDNVRHRTNSGITHNLVSITSSGDNRKLGTYIQIGSNKRFAVIKLGTNTDISQNACVFLENNWICFNGDGELKVTVESTGSNSVVTFYDDNRVTPEDITSNITFTNLTTNKDLCATPNNTYTISDQQTFYIDPSQLQGDDVNGYSITLDMNNISLVSAEITNRPYTIYKSKVILSGNTVTSTYHPESFKIKVRPMGVSTITISDSAVGNNGTRNINVGATSNLFFNYFDGYASNWIADSDDLEGKSAPKKKLSYSCYNAKVTGYSISDRMIRWNGGSNSGFRDEGVNVQSLGSSTTANATKLTQFGGWTTWPKYNYISNPVYIKWNWSDRLGGSVSVRFKSEGYKPLIFLDAYSKILFGNSSKEYKNQTSATTCSLTDTQKSCMFTNSGSCEYYGDFWVYWMVFWVSGTATYSNLNSTSGNISFIGAGKVNLAVQSTLKSKMKLNEAGNEYSINGETEISIPADKFRKNTTPEADGHYNYTLSFSLTDAEIVSNSLAQTSSHVGIWHHKITAPTHCAYVDYSQKSGNSPYISNSNLVKKRSNLGIKWDEDKECFVARVSNGYNASGENDIYNLYYSTIKYDGFLMVDDPAIHKFHLQTPSDASAEEFYAGGIFRWFVDSSVFSGDHFWCDIYDADNNSPSFIYGGYVLPVNYVLLNSGYQKWKNGTFTDPKAALDSVTEAACDKLKNSADKIYLIKYKTNETALDTCVKGNAYTVKNASELENALNKIAMDIKSTAGYKASKIVVETTGGAINTNSSSNSSENNSESSSSSSGSSSSGSSGTGSSGSSGSSGGGSGVQAPAMIKYVEKSRKTEDLLP